jgi:hypothetical protein
MICVFTIISIKFSQKGLISIIFEKVVWCAVSRAELGNSFANGNVAQYYFDGRSPDGKNLPLAPLAHSYSYSYSYCEQAIALLCSGRGGGV